MELVKCHELPNGARVYSTLINFAMKVLEHCDVPAHTFVMVLPPVDHFSYYLPVVGDIARVEKKRGRLDGFLIVSGVDTPTDGVCSQMEWNKMMSYFQKYHKKTMLKKHLQSGCFLSHRKTWIKLMTINAALSQSGRYVIEQCSKSLQ